MFEKILLTIVTFIHMMFIIFVIGTPLTNVNYFLFMHSIIIPFLTVHWICNDNTCILTTVETYLRKKVQKDKYKEEDCITCKLVNPVYDFKKNNKEYTIFIYTACMLLWMISLYKLYLKVKNNDITHWTHLYLL